MRQHGVPTRGQNFFHLCCSFCGFLFPSPCLEIREGSGPGLHFSSLAGGGRKAGTPLAWPQTPAGQRPFQPPLVREAPQCASQWRREHGLLTRAQRAQGALPALREAAAGTLPPQGRRDSWVWCVGSHSSLQAPKPLLCL